MGKTRLLVLIGCLFGGLGVAIGAMGAHGLKDFLISKGIEEPLLSKRLADCDTAVRYQMLHGLAILVVGFSRMAEQNRLLRLAAWVWFLGVVLFSGGIYSIVFFQQLGHWAIVPSGGSLMILGWILAGLANVLHSPRYPDHDSR